MVLESGFGLLGRRFFVIFSGYFVLGILRSGFNVISLLEDRHLLPKHA